MLTAFVTSPPSSAAATCSATITPARSCASAVEAARCGVTTTFGELEQRPGVRLGAEDVERGAGDLAAAERLDERVLVEELAARGVHDPDARRRMRANASAPIEPRVSAVSGRCSVRKSAAA